MKPKTKRCAICKRVKSLSKFYGYLYKGKIYFFKECKACKSKYNKKWYTDNKPEIMARRRACREREKNGFETAGKLLLIFEEHFPDQYREAMQLMREN